jgi:hypothetical protein
MRDWHYVVVTFGTDPADGWCDLNHCPMHAVGPFPTSEKAHAAAADLPEWTQPHILRVKPPVTEEEHTQGVQ